MFTGLRCMFDTGFVTGMKMGKGGEGEESCSEPDVFGADLQALVLVLPDDGGV